jgi:SnoaL-like domain
MNQADIEARLKDQVDRNEITDLVNRLGVCLDEGRFDEMRSLLVEDATARTPGGAAEGREAVVAQAIRNHRPEEANQHVISNVLIEPNGDRAEVRANLVASFASPPDPDDATPAPPVQYTVGEVYRFDVVRTPQGWRFGRVESVPVWRSGSLDRGR